MLLCNVLICYVSCVIIGVLCVTSRKPIEKNPCKFPVKKSAEICLSLSALTILGSQTDSQYYNNIDLINVKNR